MELFRDAGSIPAASTFFTKKPFGEYVEGLSHCGAKNRRQFERRKDIGEGFLEIGVTLECTATSDVRFSE